MPRIDHRHSKEVKRQKRVRAKLFGTAERPRLSIHRTNRFMSLQAIDDVAGKTVASAYDRNEKTGTKTERAVKAAQKVVDQLKKAGVTAVVFDRGAYRYHGRVRSVADAVRAAGVEV